MEKIFEKYKDDRFFNEVFTLKVYGEPWDADVVIDLGACRGEFSFYQYEKSKKIYAIEAYSEHFKDLEENLAIFGSDKIIPFRLAITGTDEKERILYFSDNNNGGASIISKKANQEIVPAKTLAQFIKDNNIQKVDLLKVDVEDAEVEIFNSSDFKDVSDRIRLIIGEAHSNVDKMKLIFESNGYKYIPADNLFTAIK